MDKALLAAEAQRMLDNEAIQAAIAHIRAEALDGLVSASPTDADAIREHQATVRVVDAFTARIARMISDGKPKQKAGLA